MFYELFILSPDNYSVYSYNSLKTFHNLKITKEYNNIGSFSFGVQYSLEEFEAIITTPAGQGEIQLFLNGVPYIQGVIKTYKPDEYGFVQVDCIEILQDLIDDVAIGDYILQNIDYEYIPPAVGMTPDKDFVSLQAPYWSLSGPGYWFSLPTNTKVVPVADEVPTSGQGLLRVNSLQPGTHFFINGVDKGVADGSVKAYTASTNITIQAKANGYADTAITSVSLSPGASIPLIYDMSTGQLTSGTIASSPVTTFSYEVMEDATGVYSSSSNTARIHNRQLHYNHQANYVMKIRSTGSAALYGSFISDTKDFNPVGIHSIINYVYTTQSIGGPRGPAGRPAFYANLSDGRTYVGLVETTLPNFTDENGNLVTGLFAAQNGSVEVEYHYVSSALYINTWCVYKITFNNTTQSVTSETGGFNVSDFNFPDFTQGAVEDPTKVTEQGSVLLGGGGNGKITGIDIDKGVKNSLLQWLQASSPRINFIKGDAAIAMDKVLRKLVYKDSDRWQIVKDIIQLAGPVTLHYKGIVGAKPTYEIYDYTQMPTVAKFMNGDEIFSLGFVEEFSDVYNVLVARATFNLSTDQYNLTNNLQVTISPTPDRPNRLGRLKRKIVSSSSIKDIETLSMWAYSLYDEHSKPPEPINFSTFIDDFWATVKFGQRITIHGIRPSTGITEQLNKITIDTQTGMLSVELAKRITFKSAFLEATLKAKNY